MVQLSADPNKIRMPNTITIAHIVPMINSGGDEAESADNSGEENTEVPLAPGGTTRATSGTVPTEPAAKPQKQSATPSFQMPQALTDSILNKNQIMPVVKPQVTSGGDGLLTKLSNDSAQGAFDLSKNSGGNTGQADRADTLKKVVNLLSSFLG